MIKKISIYIITLVLYTGLSPAIEILNKDFDAGRILVESKEGIVYTNFGNNTIKKFSPDGEYLLSIGRSGRGPGDICRIGWFAINPQNNNIYVTELDEGNKWISIFSPNGKYLGEWKINLDVKKWSGFSFIKIDDKGNAYVMLTKNIWERYKDFSLGKTKRAIYKISADGSDVKLFYTLISYFSAQKRGKGNVTIPFHNYIYFDVWDDKIAIRESCNDYIGIFSPDGVIIRKLFLPFKREKITKKDIDKWEQWMKSYPDVRKDIAIGVFDLQYWKKSLPYPEYKPVSGSHLFFDKNGYIFSKKYNGYDAERAPETWVKVDIESGKNNKIVLKNNEYLLYVKKNSVLMAVVDENDNPTFKRLTREKFGL